MRKLKTTKSEYCETFPFSKFKKSLVDIEILYLLVDIAFMFVIAKKFYYDITI